MAVRTSTQAPAPPTDLNIGPLYLTSRGQTFNNLQITSQSIKSARISPPRWCATSTIITPVYIMYSYYLGRPCGFDLHPRRESCPLETVPRDATITHRSPPCLVPQTRRQRYTAHDRRTRQCPICLSTPRRTLHGSHHQPPVEYSAGHRLFALVCTGGH